MYYVFLGRYYRALEDELVFNELVVGSVIEVLHACEASSWTAWPAMQSSTPLRKYNCVPGALFCGDVGRAQS